MKHLRWAALAALVGCSGAPAFAQEGLLIHFVCDTPDEVHQVIDILDGGNLEYGITALPGSCFWTTRFPDFVSRIGTIEEIVDVRDRGPDLPEAYIGRVTMPTMPARELYSAGFLKTG